MASLKGTVEQLVRKVEGKQLTTRIKKVPFENDPELKRDLETLRSFRGSRKFMFDGVCK